MKQLRNYKILMHGQKTIGNKLFRFSMHEDGESPKLLIDNSLSFVFVLQGELNCSFSLQVSTCLKSSQLMVINKDLLSKIKCKGETILLEFSTSPRMLQLMKRISRIFNMARSEIITLNAPVNSWCENLLNELLLDPNQDEEYYMHKCNRLSLLLLEYPRQELGTLYIPLYACTINHD